MEVYFGAAPHHLDKNSTQLQEFNAELEHHTKSMIEKTKTILQSSLQLDKLTQRPLIHSMQ